MSQKKNPVTVAYGRAVTGYLYQIIFPYRFEIHFVGLLQMKIGIFVKKFVANIDFFEIIMYNITRIIV